MLQSKHPPPTQPQLDHLCGPNGAFLTGNPHTVAATILHCFRTLGRCSRLTFQLSTAALQTEAMRRSTELLAPASLLSFAESILTRAVEGADIKRLGTYPKISLW
jgi:hypothetical protein